MHSSDLDVVKLKVFISYSRSDSAFADQLVAALTTYGMTPSIDRSGIHGAEKWQERLGQLILEADTVVFILTPDSVTSDICKWEVDEALRFNKRIIPIIWQALGEAKPHEYLHGLNYIFFYTEPSIPGSGFGTGLKKLIDTLTTDAGWIREHTHLSELATRWERDGRPDDALLRGVELERTLDWRERRPANAPDLTALQRTFLQFAEEAEAERINLERRQIEEMRAAQEAREKALKEAEAAQRAQEEALARIKTEQEARARDQQRVGYLTGTVALLAIILFAGALWQSRETQRREMLVMASLAEHAIEQKSYERAMRVAVQGLPEAGALPLISLGWDVDNVHKAFFSPDGSRIITRSWLEDIDRIWDAKTGQKLSAVSDHDSAVPTEAFSSDRDRIVSISDDYIPRVQDAKSGQVLLTLQGHDGVVWSAAFSPDGSRIVTASDDKTARVWNVEWLVKVRRSELIQRVCREKLLDGSQVFTSSDATDPILSGLAGTNPCERCGPLSLRYWIRLVGWN